MKIAIIGSGISGLVCAHLLHRDHDISVFEASDHVGGHVRTIEVAAADGEFRVDIGVAVFNESTCPQFGVLLKKLGMTSRPAEMGFSVHCDTTGLEYGTRSLNTLFAQRKNLLSASHWRLVSEISRLRRTLAAYLDSSRPEISMGDFLEQNSFSQRFIDYFVVPLGASLWLSDPAKVMDFPVRIIGRVFVEQGFLQVNSPAAWRIIEGGSSQYVRKLVRPFQENVELKTPVMRVERTEKEVRLAFSGRPQQRFDHVIFATHSNQALKILGEPTPDEYRILGAFPYQENEMVLHGDDSVLPVNRKVWSSLNYRVTAEHKGRATVTANMNILQSIPAREPFCVSLNMREKIHPDKIYGSYRYQHPVYTMQSVTAQASRDIISGRNRTHFCGAYWGNGFHEDGVISALHVASYFGKTL